MAERIGAGHSLHFEPYLRTLRRMHVNSGMHQEVSGYSDTDLFERYPLKYMNRLQPFSRYDTDAVLPRVHAVEFLGEPQYGGGRPVPPQEVWKELAPYASTRMPTSVTHSEERVWRFYAGLSDYPHYDAYRVTAPSPDAWSRYDRWGDKNIRWGAPLETIGDMTRSLRDLNRPRPIAYWSQGAHAGWCCYGGRGRTSPTPDELRAGLSCTRQPDHFAILVQPEPEVAREVSRFDRADHSGQPGDPADGRLYSSKAMRLNTVASFKTAGRLGTLLRSRGLMEFYSLQATWPTRLTPSKGLPVFAPQRRVRLPAPRLPARACRSLPTRCRRHARCGLCGERRANHYPRPRERRGNLRCDADERAEAAAANAACRTAPDRTQFRF